MYTINFRNKHHISGRKIVGLLLLLVLPFAAEAQRNVERNDARFKKRLFHFGIHMGFNVSDFKVRLSEDFVYNDSILGVRSSGGPGFNLNIMGSLHLSKNFEIKILPGVAFAEKYLNYNIRDVGVTEKKIESIYVETPFQIKFKSDPIKDFKIYVVAGMKYGYDMAANAESRRAEDLVKLTRHDLSVDYGVGFEIHFPLFILAPEFKVSNGLMDVHSPDPNLSFSRALGGLRTRMFLFSINFEG